MEGGTIPSFGSSVSLYWFGEPWHWYSCLASYKTLHVNPCNKTKHGDGECSSVSVFSHPVLSKEEGLNTVIFFYFRRTESVVGKCFLKDFVQLGIWKTWVMQRVNGKNHRCQTEEA